MTQQSKLRVIHDNIHALPLVGTNTMEGLLSEKEALRAWEDLRAFPSTTRERMQTQVESVEFDLITKLNFDEEAGTYNLSPSELRYILTRMAITATAQEASDIGQALKESAHIRMLVEGIGASACGGEDQQLSSEPQSDQS